MAYLTDEEISRLHAFVQTKELDAEFTLEGIGDQAGVGAPKLFGTRLRQTCQHQAHRVPFMRFYGFDADGEPMTTKQNKIRYIRTA